jgi:hypothetical protein
MTNSSAGYIRPTTCTRPSVTNSVLWTIDVRGAGVPHEWPWEIERMSMIISQFFFLKQITACTEDPGLH